MKLSEHPYLTRFKYPKLIETIFKDGVCGLPEVYHNAPMDLRTRAVNVSEALHRVENFAIERLALPHVEREGAFATTYRDLKVLLRSINEAVEFAKAVANEYPPPPKEIASTASEAQQRYIKSLGYPYPVHSKEEASRIINKLKREKMKR